MLLYLPIKSCSYSIGYKMGIMQIIDWCITFVIAFILFMIARLFLFPDPDLSPAKLPPEQAMAPLWRTFINLAWQAFGWIVVGITAIWIFWWILKMIPIIGQLIIAIVPPFRQLERAGIFALWNDLVVNILTLNITGIFRALIKFFKRSGQYVVKKTTGQSIGEKKEQIEKNIKSLAAIDLGIDGTSDEENPDTKDALNKEKVDGEEKQSRVDVTEESNFTPEQHKAVEDKFQMCISEKTIPIYDSMSAIERIQAQVSNNTASVACKAEAVGDYMKMKSFA